MSDERLDRKKAAMHRERERVPDPPDYGELNAYSERLVLALDGLLPLVMLDLTHKRCADPRRPRISELWPEQHERDAAVESLVMADTLACGAPPSKGKPSSLAALAKAVFYCSLVPGGIKVFGRHWKFVDEEGFDSHEYALCPTLACSPRRVSRALLEDFPGGR